MTIDADVDIVRAVYEAFAAPDVGRVFELLDPECVITQDPALPWGGRHVGHDGFTEFGLALTTAIDSAVTTEALYAADDEVIQFGRTRGTARATGTTFDIPEVHRWTIRDGKVVAAHFAIDTAAMLAVLGP
jgi:ketosteroid isomerase-like protein